MSQTFKIKLAAIAKDEGFYLPLWVYHHLRFGFDVLDIRINDTTDNSWQVLEELKTIYGERLIFSYADREMEECRAKDINFQAYIYHEIHQKTLNEDFTHLMFLDIDEYWCLANFSSTIKDFLAEVNDFDVCMFQWLMESPNAERKIDDFAFQAIITGQKSDHVKSLLNMQASVKTVRVHNYIIKGGRYILPNLAKVDFLDTDRTRGILSSKIFEENRLKIDKYFIYHQIFRSQDEYVSSLLRGNKQCGSDSLLKNNRFGFTSSYSLEYNLIWRITEGILADYLEGYKAFIQNFEIERDISRQFILERRDRVLNYLKDDVFLSSLHEDKMFGLSSEIYLPKQIKYPIQVKIKNFYFDEHKNCCNLTCIVLSEESDYDLMITKSFNKEPLDARINLIESKAKLPRIVKKYEIEVDIANLVYFLYREAPPFCLAAKIDDEIILLARTEFHILSEVIASKVSNLRKKL